jgi:hypothetical protein
VCGVDDDIGDPVRSVALEMQEAFYASQAVRDQGGALHQAILFLEMVPSWPMDDRQGLFSCALRHAKDLRAVEGGVEAFRQLVEDWRARRKGHIDFAHFRDSPYDELRHDARVKAMVLQQCADQLEALLSTLARSPQSTTEEKDAGLQRYSRPSGIAEPEASPLQPANAGFVNGTLYCYGGCGRRYEDFGLDTILPTPLWNQIAIGEPFREPHPADEKEGRGGVLCASCIVLRLAAIPDVTVAFMTTERHGKH